MSKITYNTIEHRNAFFILVKFTFNTTWNARIKKVKGAVWSKTHEGWLIPDTTENRNKCSLGEENIKTKSLIKVEKNVIVKNKVSFNNTLHPDFKNLSANNQEQMRLYLQQLTLKGYSRSTIRTYQNEFSQMLNLLNNVEVQSLQPCHLQRFLLRCIKNGLKENTVHSRINALKFYYERVLHRDKFFFEILRPKKPLQLPKLLNENELARLFNAVVNSKHKANYKFSFGSGQTVGQFPNCTKP